MTGWLMSKETKKVKTGIAAEAQFNKMGFLYHYSTNTTAYNPVKVLGLNSTTRYALFQNNSDKDVWLYATTTALNTTEARQYFNRKDGILLLAKQASSTASWWEITPNNLIYGNIWASSTATGKNIIVNYK